MLNKMPGAVQTWLVVLAREFLYCVHEDFYVLLMRVSSYLVYESKYKCIARCALCQLNALSVETALVKTYICIKIMHAYGSFSAEFSK
jgi:hypothetical protein